jgi:ParB-like chromosome segregation protein Spo0J
MALQFTTAIPASRVNTFKFDPRYLASRFSKFTGRYERTDESIEAIAASFLLHGQEQDILCRKADDGDPVPVDGHTRILAACRITEESRGIHSPDNPFLVRAGFRQMNAEEALFHGFVANSTSTPASDMDAAFLIRTVSETTALNDSQIAEKLGKTPNWVSRHRKLLDLPGNTQHLLATGKINMEKALLLHKVAADKQAEVVAGGAKVARAAGAVVPHTDADFKKWVKAVKDKVPARGQAFLSLWEDYRKGKATDEELTDMFVRLVTR